MKIHAEIEQFKMLYCLMSDIEIHMACNNFLESIDTISETLDIKDKLDLFHAFNHLSSRSTRILSLTMMRNFIFEEIRDYIASNVEVINNINKEVIANYFNDCEDDSLEGLKAFLKNKDTTESEKLRRFIRKRMEEY